MSMFEGLANSKFGSLSCKVSIGVVRKESTTVRSHSLVRALMGFRQTCHKKR